MFSEEQFSKFMDAINGKAQDHDDLIRVQSELGNINRTIQFGQESIIKSISLQEGAIKAAHNRVDNLESLVRQVVEQNTNMNRFIIGTVLIGGLGVFVTILKLFFFK